jgi:hypothetical protein
MKEGPCGVKRHPILRRMVDYIGSEPDTLLTGPHGKLFEKNQIPGGGQNVDHGLNWADVRGHCPSNKRGKETNDGSSER